MSNKLKLIQPQLKVLYMSGYVGDKLHGYGPLEVLEKPFAKDELLGRVRAAFGPQVDTVHPFIGEKDRRIPEEGPFCQQRKTLGVSHHWYG